jgi:pimeloyl-ACP methyl ester carboxylesterase
MTMSYFVAPGESRKLGPLSRGELRGSFIELSDGVTHYELAGPAAGELVVLIGGLTIPLFYWDKAAAELQRRGFRTLAYSCYGRGYSDRVNARYDESLFVRQLAELTRAVGAAPFHLVGTSMGALIAMLHAGRHPETLATLSLAGPAGLANKPALPRWIARSDMLTGFFARSLGRRMLMKHLDHNVADPRSAADLRAMIEDAFQCEGSLFAVFSTLQDFGLAGRAPLYEATGTLAIPTLLLWGRQDRVTPISQLDEARRLLRPTRCHVIESCGHMAPLERPQEVADHIAAIAALGAKSGAKK